MARTETISAQISNLAVSASFEQLSDRTVYAACQGLLDFYGCLLAGCSEPLAQILQSQFSGHGKTSIIGTESATSPHDAALINGATAHALDYDDCNLMGHTTVAVLPAILAVAEIEGTRPKDILSAYVTALNITNYLAQQLMPDHYQRGFHSTSTIGSLGAAIGAGCVLGLAEEEMQIAIGLAATQAAGLKSMFGTMAKPFHAGKAAANGVIAAQLASRGFTAHPSSLETDQGFFSALSSVTPRVIENYTPGKYMDENLYKFHASCFQTHPTLNAVNQIFEENRLSAGEIEQVLTTIPETGLKMCCIPEPKTGLEVKFSLAHCTAMAMSGRDTARISSFTDKTAHESELIQLRSKVKITGELPPGLKADVKIVTKSGQKFTASSDVTIPLDDLGKQESLLRRKFQSLCETMFSEDIVHSIAEQILSFPELDSLTALHRNLVAS